MENSRMNHRRELSPEELDRVTGALSWEDVLAFLFGRSEGDGHGDQGRQNRN